MNVTSSFIQWEYLFLLYCSYNYDKFSTNTSNHIKFHVEFMNRKKNFCNNLKKLNFCNYNTFFISYNELNTIHAVPLIEVAVIFES